jgi:putative ABC transport system permease protein
MARQLVTEALVLSTCATALGLLVAHWSHTLILAAGRTALPRLSEVSLSVPVLLFAAGLAMLTTLLFGVVPALQLSASAASEALKDGARGGTAAGRAHVRRALVVCQVAIAVVLLVGAGLLLKSFTRVLSVPSGIDPDHVLTARVAVPPARYPGLPEVSGFFARLVERVRLLPGVETAGASSGLPLAVVSGDWGFDIEGRPRVNGRKPGRADWYVVTPGYLEALRIRIVAGRGPEESDTEQANPVIFLNESAARAMFPEGDALGKRIRLSNTTGPLQPWRTIAGIVGDVRARGLEEEMRTEMFIPYRQFLHFSNGTQARIMTLVVRTAGRPEQLISAIRGELRAIDPMVPLADVRTMGEVLSASMSDRRLSLTLVGAFALLAIVLATVGIYGVVAFDALQRTREIGIRIALGASRRSVLSMMLKRGLTLVSIGAAVGLAAAAMLTGGLSVLLFQVGPRDAAVFAAVALLLGASGVAATYVPARRATRIDPLSALRTE